MNDQVQDEWVDFYPSGPATTDKEDDWSDFEPQQPGQGLTNEEVITQGIVGGGIESIGMMGGAALGAKAGAVAGPWGAGAGAIVGGIAGLVGGSKARDVAADQGYTFKSIEDLPESQRAVGVASETFGAGVTGGGIFLGLAKGGFSATGTGAIGNFINRIFTSAKSSPYLFMGGELSASSSSALGGAAAQTIDPNNPLPRFVGETVGGVLNPTKLTISLGKNIYDRAANTFSRMTPAGQETAASKMLNRILSERNENPEVLLKLLKNYDPEVTTNAAIITGSPTLGALQAQLSAYSSKFGAEAGAQSDAVLEVMTGIVQKLRATGDPQALQDAAEMQRDITKTILAADVQRAEAKAIEAVKNITADTPAARSEISKIARTALDESLTNARKAESEMWSNVPNGEAGVENFYNAYQGILDELPEQLRGQKGFEVPEYVTDFLETVRSKQGGWTSSDELTKWRSLFLREARDAGNAGEYNNARIFSTLASSILDDLDQAFDGDVAYDAARNFSRDLNDTFTRSFAGQATGTGKYGDMVPPELLLIKATASGPEATNLKLIDLERATAFMAKEPLVDTPEQWNTMVEAQERFLRLAGAESIENGVVNPKKLQKFIDDNEVILGRFPEMKTQLQDAVSSENARLGMIAQEKETTRVFETQSEYSKLLKKDSVELSKAALKAENPEKAFSDLIKVAKNAGEEGKAGLRASVLDAALSQAEAGGKGIDFAKLKSILFETKTPGRKPAMDSLVKNGIFSKEDVKSMENVFQIAENLQTSKKPGTAIDVNEDSVDVIMDLLTRAAGATIATKATNISGQKAAGHGLIIAAGGSRAAKQMVEKIPNASIKTILIEAMSNPRLMVKLLEKTPTPEAKVEKMRFLNAYFINAGIFNAKDEYEKRYQKPVTITPNSMSAM